MKLNLGAMNRIITVEQFTATGQADSGEPAGSWGTYTQLYAEVIFVGGRERYVGYGRQASVTAVFYTRYDDGITPDMRIDLDGSKYGIEYVNEIGLREGLEIRARVLT